MPDETLPAIVEPTPLLLIQQALDAKISPRDLKDLFDLQERHEKNLAEREYANAITAFQAACPAITNTKAVQGTDGRERYRYAPFEHIMCVILPHLRANRIVISFDTKPREGGIEVTCRVRVGTVEKCTTVLAAFQQANKMMNDTQVGRAAESYGKRGALTLALNLVCTDEDTDAQPEPTGTISVAQQDDLDELLRAAGCQNSNHLRLALNWIAKAQGLPCNSLADVTCAAYPRIVAEFQSRAGRRTQAEAARKANGGGAA